MRTKKIARANVKPSLRRSKDVYDRLYCAVADYVAANDGNVLLAGGVSIVELPEPYSYVIGVKCVGKLPVVKEAQ